MNYCTVVLTRLVEIQKRRNHSNRIKLNPAPYGGGNLKQTKKQEQAEDDRDRANSTTETQHNKTEQKDGTTVVWNFRLDVSTSRCDECVFGKPVHHWIGDILVVQCCAIRWQWLSGKLLSDGTAI